MGRKGPSRLAVRKKVESCVVGTVSFKIILPTRTFVSVGKIVPCVVGPISFKLHSLQDILKKSHETQDKWERALRLL
jgi:hypothetical protein